MTKFATLYDTNDDQILVVLSADLNGQPVVNVSCLAPTLVGDDTPHVVVNQLRYADEQTARVAFDTMSEERAREHASFVREKLAEQLGQLATRSDLS